MTKPVEITGAQRTSQALIQTRPVNYFGRTQNAAVISGPQSLIEPKHRHRPAVSSH